MTSVTLNSPTHQWCADWQELIFSDASRHNLYCKDRRVLVRLYIGELFLLQCLIERTDVYRYGLGMLFDVRRNPTNSKFQGLLSTPRKLLNLKSSRFFNEFLEVYFIRKMLGHKLLWMYHSSSVHINVGFFHALPALRITLAIEHVWDYIKLRVAGTSRRHKV